VIPDNVFAALSDSDFLLLSLLVAGAVLVWVLNPDRAG
jgi:hypothetical protein